jgi:hypothetical protein
LNAKAFSWLWQTRPDQHFSKDFEHAEQHAKHLSYARSIWEAAKPAKGTLVERYLSLEAAASVASAEA